MQFSVRVLVSTLAFVSAPVFAEDAGTDMIQALAPMIRGVHGAMRDAMERGKGCWPWMILATDPNDSATYAQLGIDQDLLGRLGGSDAASVAKFAALAAKKSGATLSVLGTCETDPTVNGTQSPNTLALLVERKNVAAIQLRFGFQQDRDNKVSFVPGKLDGRYVKPLVFPAEDAAPAASSLSVVEQDQFYELTVPQSRLVIRLPKASFKRVSPPDAGGGTRNPRYFMFADPSQAINLSGWFEPASRFEGVKDSPPQTVQGKTIEHKHVNFKKTGAWDTVEYDFVEDSPPLNMANVHAHLVRAGTWVELHLSKNAKQDLAEQHAALARALQSIEIVER